ncbi:MAG: hypothetical protein RL700_535 [Pseudomonadota bacterium]|jgi:hypothetical protein
MDDLVKQAMQKWPNVPHCYGWLGLDQRGDWYMRDDQTQAQGSFAQAKGSRLQHDKLIAFIQRNYLSDELGQWYFQNGPQRVFVELLAAPFVWRVHDDWRVWSADGQAQHVLHCVVDEAGWVYLLTHAGLGLVHSQDVGVAADALSANHWEQKKMHSSELERTYGFVKSPHQRAQGIT